MRTLSLAIGLGLSFAVATVAQPVLEVTLSPTDLTIGDRAELVVTVSGVSARNGESVRFQPWGDTLGPAEILDIGPVEQRPGPNGTTVYRQRLSLTLFQLGEVVLPPVEAFVSGPKGEVPLTSVSSRASVTSVLPEGDGELEAKPPAPPQRPGMGESFWWSAGALLATCLVALVALWHQSNGLDHGEAGSSRLAPIEELRRSLAALKSQGEMVPFHADLSLAVRRFLGRTLEFPAPESTTTEIRRTLLGRSMSPDLIRETTQLLSSCDMVKFARQEVAPATAMDRVGNAERIGSSLSRAVTPDDSQDADDGDVDASGPVEETA